MALLPQGISRSGFFSPLEATDGILHSITLKGGYQEMLTLNDRNLIKSFLNIPGAVYDGFTQSNDVWSTGRRRVGMMIYVVEEKKLYNLIPVGFFGNGGELGQTEWLAMPEWERALRLDPSGAFTSESASPVNGFQAVIETAADLGISSDANSCWVQLSVDGAPGVDGVDGTNGQSSYLHIAYANDTIGGGFSKTQSNDKIYIGQYTDFNISGSDDHSAYIWTLLKGEKGDAGDAGLDGIQGPSGADGVEGPKGSDGLATYFHIAYADNASGGGFSQDAANKLYIGTYVDGTEDDAGSDSPIWKWQLVKGIDGENGENGIPGTSGTDGQTSYLHLAYANNSTGTTGFSISDSDNKLYIGQYTDFNQPDLPDPAVYKWTLIKGERGDSGERGLQGLQGNNGENGVAGPKGADGVQTFFHIAYADDISGGGFSQDAANKLCIGTYVNETEADAAPNSPLWKWQIVKGIDGQNGENGIPGTSGNDGQTTYLHIAYADNKTGLNFSTTDSNNKLYIGQYTDFLQPDSSNHTVYTWTLIKGDQGEAGPQGPIGVQGLQGLQGVKGYDGIKGDAGSSGISTYFHIAYADNASGGGFSQNASLGKLYMGTYVDYTQLDAGPTSNLWKWQLVKGADGQKGENGIKGVDGETGATTYLHIAYANAANSTNGFSTTDSNNKLYIGQYTDTNLVDSLVPSKYLWTKVKGDTGSQGPAGPTGPAGAVPNLSSYLTTSTNIDGGKITTGIIKNGQFSGVAGWNNYASLGMGINLDNGAINAKNFYISPLGDAKFRGDMDIEGGATIAGGLASTIFDFELDLSDAPVLDANGYRKLRFKPEVKFGDTRFSDFRSDFDLISTDYTNYKTLNPIGDDPVLLREFTASHNYIKRNDIQMEVGDLVKLDENNELVKASSAQDTAIVGILWQGLDFTIKDSPLDKFLPNGKDTSEKPHHYRDSLGNKIPVADRDIKTIWKVASVGDSREGTLTGMKVCDQNGLILKGDLVCSSDVPGYVMKQPVEYVVIGFENEIPQYEERQTINSFTVGKCMETCSFNAEGKVEGIYGYLYCG